MLQNGVLKKKQQQQVLLFSMTFSMFYGGNLNFNITNFNFIFFENDDILYIKIHTIFKYLRGGKGVHNIKLCRKKIKL